MAQQEERLSGALQAKSGRVPVWFVYYLRDAHNVLIYIGRAQDPDERWRAFEVRHGIAAYLTRLEVFTDLEEACIAERTAILHHRPAYNAKASSTRGMTGKHQSEETRQKIAAQIRGIIRSTETRERVRKARTGKPSPRKGVPVSPEALERIRAGIRQRELRKRGASK